MKSKSRGVAGDIEKEIGPCVQISIVDRRASNFEPACLISDGGDDELGVRLRCE